MRAEFEIVCSLKTFSRKTGELLRNETRWPTPCFQFGILASSIYGVASRTVGNSICYYWTSIENRLGSLLSTLVPMTHITVRIFLVKQVVGWGTGDITAWIKSIATLITMSCHVLQWSSWVGNRKSEMRTWTSVQSAASPCFVHWYHLRNQFDNSTCCKIRATWCFGDKMTLYVFLWISNRGRNSSWEGTHSTEIEEGISEWIEFLARSIYYLWFESQVTWTNESRT